MIIFNCKLSRRLAAVAAATTAEGNHVKLAMLDKPNFPRVISRCHVIWELLSSVVVEVFRSMDALPPGDSVELQMCTEIKVDDDDDDDAAVAAIRVAQYYSGLLENCPLRNDRCFCCCHCWKRTSGRSVSFRGGITSEKLPQLFCLPLPFKRRGASAAADLHSHTPRSDDDVVVDSLLG